jgi:hypothetical protein
MRKDENLTAGSARAARPFPPSFMDRLGEGRSIAGVPPA